MALIDRKFKPTSPATHGSEASAEIRILKQQNEQLEREKAKLLHENTNLRDGIALESGLREIAEKKLAELTKPSKDTLSPEARDVLNLITGRNSLKITKAEFKQEYDWGFQTIHTAFDDLERAQYIRGAIRDPDAMQVVYEATSEGIQASPSRSPSL